MVTKVAPSMAFVAVVACLCLSTKAASAFQPPRPSSRGSYFLVAASSDHHHRQSSASFTRPILHSHDNQQRNQLATFLSMSGGDDSIDKEDTAITTKPAEDHNKLPTDKSVKQLISLFW